MCHSFYVFELHKPKKKTETIIDNHRSTSFLDGYEKKTATNFIGIPNTCFIKKNTKAFGYMTGSCHLDRAMKVKYLFSFLLQLSFTNLGHILGMCALTQKRSFLVLCTAFRSDFHVWWKNQNKHWTLNLSFNALSKWHDLHFSIILVLYIS